jgi:hypothetical protein
MTSRAAILPAVVFSMCTLSGCVSTQAPADGSTRVNPPVAAGPGTNKTPVAPAPPVSTPAQQHAVTAPVPGARPAGFKLSSTARASLVQMLSCKSANGNHTVAKEMAATGWRLGTLFPLDKPVLVFGLPVQTIMVEGNDATETYHSYFTGVSKKQMIKAARLRLGRDKINYGRLTRLGVLEFHPSGSDTSVSCHVDFEGSYDDMAAAARKKRK